MSAESRSLRRIGDRSTAFDESGLSHEERLDVARRHAEQVLADRVRQAPRTAALAEARGPILKQSALIGAAAGCLGVAGASRALSRRQMLTAQRLPASSFVIFVAFFMPFAFVANFSRTRLQKRAASRVAENEGVR